MSATAIGRVLGYRSADGTALVLVRQPIRKGDRLRILGRTTAVEVGVTKLRVFYAVEQAGAMEQICMVVPAAWVRSGDTAFRTAAAEARDSESLVS